MNNDKVKFKYLMNLWKSLPDYPTEEDIIYELSSYMVKDGRSSGEFTTQTFNSVFGRGWMETKHAEVIQNMLDSGIFIESENSKPDRIKYILNETPIYSK
jgi:hypothetical protein